MIKRVLSVGLVCLAVCGNLFGISEDHIRSLNREIENLDNSLTIIEQQLIKITNLFELERNELQNEKRRLQNEKKEIEKELKQAESDLKKFQELEAHWKDSETQLEKLKRSINQTENETRVAIAFRDILAGAGFAISGGLLTYQLSQDPWLSLGIGLGSGLTTWFILKIF